MKGPNRALPVPRSELVIVCAPPLPSVGGIQAFTTAFSRQVRSMGVPVTIVSSRGAEATFDAEYDGHRALRLHSFQAIGGRFPLPRSPVEIWRAIRDTIVRKPGSFLVVQARFYVASLLFATAARLLGRPVLVVDHGSEHLTVHNRLADRAIAAYEHVATAWLRLIGVTFAAVSPNSAAWLRHFGITGPALLPNGVDEVLLGRAEGRTPRTTCSVLYCGRMLSQKGLLELIEAVRLLQEDAALPCSLTILGDGPLAAELRTRLHGCGWATYVGSCSHDRVLDALRNADVVVVPSKWPEGSPSIILESAALAIPVVATTCADGARLLEEDETGLVLASADPRLIADALRRIRDEPGLATRLGDGLHNRVKHRYTWRVIASEFLTRNGFAVRQPASLDQTG